MMNHRTPPGKQQQQMDSGVGGMFGSINNHTNVTAMSNNTNRTTDHIQNTIGMPFGAHETRVDTVPNFQSSIFDTPPSLMASPQYSGLFSSPINANTPRQNGCSLCHNDVTLDPNTVAFSNCSHRYCVQCSSVTVHGDNRVCPVCVSISLDNPFRLNPVQYMPSPEKSVDLNTTLTSRLSVSGSDTMKIDPFRGIWGDGGGNREMKGGAGMMNRTVDSITSPVFSPSSPSARHNEVCSACQDGHSASHFCHECSELLCGDCVVAHHRVRITRDHTVTALDVIFKRTQNNTVTRPLGSDSSALGDDHSLPVCTLHDSPTLCVCESPCDMVHICTKCLPDHHRHRLVPIGDPKSAVVQLLSEIRKYDKSLEESQQTIQHMAERVDASVQSTASDLRAEIHKHISALEERKRELLQRVDTIRQRKVATLKMQTDGLIQKRNQLMQALKTYDIHFEDFDSTKFAIAFDQLVQIFSIPQSSLEPHETDLIKFTVIDTQLINKIRNLGELECGPSAITTSIVGEGFRRAIRDRQCTVTVQLRDSSGEGICVAGHAQLLEATFKTPDGSMVDVTVSEREVGIVSVSYLPTVDGIHVLNITLRGLSISGCPVNVEVRKGRDYKEIGEKGELFHFGKEGSGDGELCRPWGICCDMSGRLIVADRSNNRIQMFDLEGTFLGKFGTGGTRAGQFDRPAGVCVNAKKQIVVADKDNHRIQVFDENGNFVLMFGERGRSVGMFNYPWGVATNSNNNIAVSDTRNHRVQIFTSMGQFIRKCGFDTAFFYKHLDSPRGLCYLPDGQLLITDFNNHRLVLTGPRIGPEMKCYGTEGDQEGMFLRPQGVKVDPEGHILVCDSRNNRIQVFSADDMHCVATFGGSKPVATVPMQHPILGTVPPPPFSLMNVQGGGGGVPSLMGGGAMNMAMMQTPPPPLMRREGFEGGEMKRGGGEDGEGPSASSASSLLDRPTDICVSPDGRIYVVDFGNNCIRVF